MTYKEWVKRLFLLVGILLALIISISIIVDPYAVFWKNPNKCSEPNERYCKITYLSYHPKMYEGFLFGSSRIGTTEPFLLQKYYSKIKFYNMTVSAGTLSEFEDMFKKMLNMGVKAKVIYLQIDVYDNLMTYKNERSKLLLRMKPENNIKERVSFFKDYLLLPPNNENLIRQLKQDLGVNKASVRYDFYGSGCWYADNKEKAIRINPISYVKDEETFHKTTTKTLEYNRIVMLKNLQSLKNIKQMAKNNGIEIILFVAPHNHKMLDAIGMDGYQQFLRKLADITDYWDFSGYNSVTMNDMNYYEYSHYRPHVAKWIVSRIFHDTDRNTPTDFGVYVSRKNIKRIDNMK